MERLTGASEGGSWIGPSSRAARAYSALPRWRAAPAARRSPPAAHPARHRPGRTQVRAQPSPPPLPQPPSPLPSPLPPPPSPRGSAACAALLQAQRQEARHSMCPVVEVAAEAAAAEEEAAAAVAVMAAAAARRNVTIRAHAQDRRFRAFRPGLERGSRRADASLAPAADHALEARGSPAGGRTAPQRAASLARRAGCAARAGGAMPPRGSRPSAQRLSERWLRCRWL